jgi:hypothetical protein
MHVNPFTNILNIYYPLGPGGGQVPVSSAMMLRLREEHENRVLHALPYSFRRFSQESKTLNL